MDSRTFTVQQIFQDRRQYRVPFYQRPYVWNRDDQWGRLWEDIRDKADTRLQGGKAFPHFMGAVVLEPQKKIGLLGVERHHIIDGQQRLTTLQYVLTALVHALRSAKNEKLLPLIDACLSNSNPETMEEVAVESFKLWPTFRDRKQYEQAMTAGSLEDLRLRFPASFTQTGSLRKIGVMHPPALEAIVFFHDQMVEWVNDNTEGDAATRSMALASAVLTDLSIVCISLGDDDDAQVIFETLNGHGAELHATDLIRNFIFMRAGTNADDLYNNLWSQFEAPLWSEAQSRGRLNRPRLEWFVQTAVQAQTGDEIDVGRLYAGYRRFVDGTVGLHGAGSQLEMLNRYGEHYKALVTGAGNAPIAAFGRSVAVWDASPTHALALRVAASSLSQIEQQEIFGCIESYLVRRAVCGLSRKNYNKVFAQQLRRLIESDLNAASFRKALTALTGDASRWPGDEEFRRQWLDGGTYPGRLDAPKLRTVFHRLETEIRTEKTEEPIPLALDSLDIDHILPQSWYTYWTLADGTKVSIDEAQAAAPLRYLTEGVDAKTQSILKRLDAVPRIGNLTLVHYGVNRALQNHGFEAKRRALFEHSNLQLNRGLMQCTAWDESAIEVRGEELLKAALRIWPGPV
ncbi:MAG: DUF262 domain-containing HNH endonuclease family protein [Gammaproteobacteria bacterium]|uniref:DUF262 domain-containing protein n=1 Tax=Hydrogenophaga sp. TaxID=1904254 RepID=UPI0025B83864|nr:DUF262 domain-containing HNH endonuclease family protein [Hydrogenophaga sp.]MBU4281380.1 DUF262 domain-containing HNH endonuclease family protein [Gammaproteobacteria bacterium]